MADLPWKVSERSPSPQAPRPISLVTRIAGAREVVITGDFTSWAKDRVRMRNVKGDEWQADLRLVPGQYQYRLLVDGQWKDHAEAAQRITNPFGSQNCVLSVPKT